MTDWVQAPAHKAGEIKSATKEHLIFTYSDWWATEELEECPPPEALFPEFSYIRSRRARRFQRRVVHLRDIGPQPEPVFFTPMFLTLFPQLYPSGWQEWARGVLYVIPVLSPLCSSLSSRQPTTSADENDNQTYTSTQSAIAAVLDAMDNLTPEVQTLANTARHHVASVVEQASVKTSTPVTEDSPFFSENLIAFRP